MHGEEYKGEVLFIVHTPEIDLKRPNDSLWIKLVRQNRRRIKQALTAAGKKGVPIISFPAYTSDGEDTLRKLIEPIKKKPKIIEIEEWINLEPKHILTALNYGKITPTHITFLGQIRDMCVERVAHKTRAALPNTPITVMEGKGTIHWQNPYTKRAYLQRFKSNDILRTKKLKVKSWKKY